MQETLFILKNAALFRTAAGESYQVCIVVSDCLSSITCQGAPWCSTSPQACTLLLQVIDLPNQRLNNVIEFPPAGAFVVDSTLSVAGPQRLQFQFNGASLRTDKRTISLPPFGKGW